ncbi:type IV toxin-antitoxin system AbiEi family antitoxin [Nocardioides sp. NPDC101246]|uniref:type IV toxin-antitoxin system AbiEi family antitoxin n=1 Tax=Nocardioides sp. NPDC101246 TaxID=3364336 RepID=UPI003803E277
MAIDPDAAVTHLNDLGLTLELESTEEVPNGDIFCWATLSRGGVAAPYTFLGTRRVRLADARGALVLAGDRPLLLWTHHIPPKTADALRRAGIQYADEAGNAHIEFGDVLVDIRGRRPSGPAPQSPTTTATNLFSTSRSQIVFALLAWPALWKAPQREIAQASGVSVGLVNDTLRLLHGSGYDLPASGRRSGALLDHWAAAFPSGLAPRLRLADFHGDIDVENLRGTSIYISGESAVRDVIRPATLTIYVDDLTQPDGPSLPILNRWRTDGTMNVFVRRKFWRDPGAEERPSEPRRLSPWPLVYADLLATGDPRLRTVAQDLRDHEA